MFLSRTSEMKWKQNVYYNFLFFCFFFGFAPFNCKSCGVTFILSKIKNDNNNAKNDYTSTFVLLIKFLQYGPTYGLFIIYSFAHCWRTVIFVKDWSLVHSYFICNIHWLLMVNYVLLINIIQEIPYCLIDIMWI